MKKRMIPVLLCLFCLLSVLAGCRALGRSVGNMIADTETANTEANTPASAATDSQDGFYVEDRAGILGSDTTLLGRMEEFYQKTGVVPVFITVYNSDWENKYPNITNYAYDEYLNLFNDENHMLIVYSQPENATAESGDWYWELMQWDDTDPVLTKEVDELFVETFQNNLLSEGVSVEDALIAAFDEIMK